MSDHPPGTPPPGNCKKCCIWMCGFVTFLNFVKLTRFFGVAACGFIVAVCALALADIKGTVRASATRALSLAIALPIRLLIVF